MASSKVVMTNPDLPRQSSTCSISTLLADLHHTNNYDASKSIAMDDLLKSTTSSIDTAAKTVDEVWKEIVAGTDSLSQTRVAGEPLEEMTLEDFLTKAVAVRDEAVTGIPNPTLLPVPVEDFGNGIQGTVVGVAPPPAATGRGGGRGKKRAVEEPLDKATLQKQRRMIKNRESAARSRERKQAYTVELESLVTHLEEENARLLRAEADKKKLRFKQLMECLIPVVEMRKPRRKLRRVNSVQW